MRKDREGATGQIYGFLVGGVIFLAALAAIFAFTEGAGREPVGARTAEQSVDAGNLVSLIIGSQGSGWSDPDALARFGLLNATGAGLDPQHLQMLNPGTDLEAQDNGLLDYEEARAALGLTGASGFRMAVTALDYEAALKQHDFSHIKALYIGDFTSLSTITLGVGQGNIANGNLALNASMGPNTGLERTVIDSIGVDFDNQMHLTTSTPTILVQITTVPDVKVPLLTHLGLTLWDGDVLYDNKQMLDDVLPGKLAFGGYDLLVLGSGIDHSTLTANSVKSSIDAFVRGGGTLMVFGSPGGNFNWMQPIMDLSAASVSGAVTAVDADHEILTTPWDLDWATYPTNNLAWTIGIPTSFENVLMQGGKPVVAVSNDGAIGSGNVFLSSIQPRAVAALLGPDEAAHFMFNMLLYDRDSADDPTVVFGPDPPLGTPVSAARRTTVVVDDGIEIPVRIELLAWAT
ncbi:MAG: hypothetical protein AABY18_08945 [Candidatus Thermoplasmatota archaeon]